MRKIKITESICKPKGLGKKLESLGVPNEISSCEVSGWKIINAVEYDASTVLEGFKNYYSIFPENLVKMLPKAPN